MGALDISSPRMRPLTSPNPCGCQVLQFALVLCRACITQWSAALGRASLFLNNLEHEIRLIREQDLIWAPAGDLFLAVGAIDEFAGVIDGRGVLEQCWTRRR